MTSPAPIPTERLIRELRIAGTRIKRAAGAVELHQAEVAFDALVDQVALSLRQQAQPTREEGWRVKPLEEALISTVRLLRARANAGSWWNDHAIWEHCRDLERKLIGFQGTGDGSPKFRALKSIDAPAREGGGEVREQLLKLERYSQFTDGWGDEVIGLKQHPTGDYVKWSDILHVVQAIPAVTDEKEGNAA